MFLTPNFHLVVSAIIVPIASFVPLLSLTASAGDAQAETRRTQVNETFRKLFR